MRNASVVSLFLCVCFLSACAAPITPVAPTPSAVPSSPSHRVHLFFNPDWKYHAGDVLGADAQNFDDAAWAYVDLPHSTTFVTPENPNAYLGISWYRKHFSIPNEYQERKIYIEFEAAMQSADVWLNGAKKIRHVGGYTPFTIDITNDVLYDADNVLAVKLDSKANPDWAPGKNEVDFQYYGGLYRNVNLYVTDKLHITDAVYPNVKAGGGVFVTYSSVSTHAATVHIKTHVFNENADAKNATLISEIRDADGNVVGVARATETIPANAQYHFEQSIIITNPKLWHPYTPNLYTLHSIVQNGAMVTDEYKTRIGIRHIGWSHDGGLEINGARFQAVGVNMHQVIFGLGNAMPNRAIYYDVKRIKDGGLNWIRAAHYPHAPAFYDAADELGILVLDSLTGWQQFNATPAFHENTFQELRDLIRRDRNHPSIAAWEASLNESEFTDAWAKTAHEIVHAEYPGDQAFSAAWKGSHADIFIGASQHNIRTTQDARPIIISEYGDWEYGGGNSTTRQERAAGDNAMLLQARNVQDARNQNAVLGWFTADGYWEFQDYGGFSDYGNTRAGLVDMYRLPKFAYYFLQSQRDANVILDGINSGPLIFIANHWTPTSPTTVMVYSNCEKVALYLNDALFATQAPDAGTNLAHPPFTFHLEKFTPGILRADCLIGNVVRATFTRQTPGDAVALSLRAEADNLQADLSDARLIFIESVDANGTVVYSDNREVNLSINGAGSIAGPTTVQLKGGQLATWVRAGRVDGNITVTATAEGLNGAKLILTSESVPNFPPAPLDRK